MRGLGPALCVSPVESSSTIPSALCLCGELCFFFFTAPSTTFKILLMTWCHTSEADFIQHFSTGSICCLLSSVNYVGIPTQHCESSSTLSSAPRLNSSSLRFIVQLVASEVPLPPEVTSPPLGQECTCPGPTADGQIRTGLFQTTCAAKTQICLQSFFEVSSHP